MIRLLYVITSLRRGGAETLVCDMLPRLKDKGCEVELLVFDGVRTHLLDRLENSGIIVHKCGRGAWQMWNPLNILKIRKIAKKRKYNIIHTHNSPAQFFTAISAIRKYSILITTEHNVHNRRRNWGWFKKIDMKIYERYERIINVSDTVQSKFLKYYGNALSEKTLVIPNGIDLKRFSEAKSLEKDKNKFIIVMAGAFRPQKDQATLIRAFKYLDERYILWLAGGWVGKEKCEKLVKSLELDDRVLFLGIRNDLPEVYATADAIVLSSHYEGLSLSSLEGMATGKPFISSNVEGLKEIVGEVGMLFPEKDYITLAKLIREVCENEELGKKIGKNCKDRAMGFDINKTVGRYHELYEELYLKNNISNKK